MSTDLLNGPPFVNAAVEVNHEVITDAPEATLLVPGIDVGDREGLALRRSRTMNDDFANLSNKMFYFNNL